MTFTLKYSINKANILLKHNVVQAFLAMYF
jgi:hypothetical protein